MTNVILFKGVYQQLGATPKHWLTPKFWMTPGENIESQSDRHPRILSIRVGEFFCA